LDSFPQPTPTATRPEVRARAEQQLPLLGYQQLETEEQQLQYTVPVFSNHDGVQDRATHSLNQGETMSAKCHQYTLLLCPEQNNVAC
jgi:hypothetical protein